MAVTANDSQFQHSPFISERRRALFPNEKDDSDSDLGHISPINYDSNSDSLSVPNSPHSDPNDYQIIDNHPTPVTPTTRVSTTNSETMSPLFLSPLSHGIPSVSFYGRTKSFSPSQTQKTPHDSTNNSKMPKLIRKSLLDSLSDENTFDSGKRKALSPINEPSFKHVKLEPNPKVRTALFKDNSISTATFYPKPSGMKNQIKTSIRKTVPIHRPYRSTFRKNIRNRKQLGTINAGVKHKIRRPRVKPIDKEVLMQAAMNIIENSPLNDYLNDLKQFNCSGKQLIMPANEASNKENVAPSSSRKRERSPSPDPTKKFFKHAHAKATVTMSKNMKLELDNGKLSLVSKSKPQVDLDTFDDGSPIQSTIDIDGIIGCLDNTIDLQANNSVTESDKSIMGSDISNNLQADESNTLKVNNSITLQAHNSIKASDNSILLHAPLNKRTEDIKKPETMLSPTSLMCNMTSGLALNSPKKAKNLTSILENLPASPSSSKLYPIFENKSPKMVNKKSKDEIRPVKSVTKTWKKLPKNQMLLDAGQKRFGYTHCTECDTIYHMGDPGDELMHFNYHNALNVFKFPGWKDEKIISTIPPDARIIQTDTSCKPRLRKILEIVNYVNREFGFSIDEQNLDANVFFYIKSRKIVGFLMAQKDTAAYKMLSSENTHLCSEEVYPIKCNVSHIWVSPNFRQKGIGSALMDALKKNFLPGQHLTNLDIAFSSPTEAGKKFCEKYFKTVNYLVTM